MQPLYNLHNHTPFSDGAFTIDEICEAHVDLPDPAVQGLGICDHLFCTPSSHAPSNIRDFERIFLPEAQRYHDQVRDAAKRWEGRLEILCGCEITWSLNRAFIEQIRGALANFDFVLFENLDWSGLTQLASVARRFPCRVGLAHTSVSEQFPNTPPEQVVRTLANARIFYELNTKHLPFSPSDPWLRMLPQHKVTVSIGTDTHDDLSVLGTLRGLAATVERAGLHDRLFTPQPMIRTAAVAESTSQARPALEPQAAAPRAYRR